MQCEDSFSCNANEWKIYQKTIKTLEHIANNDDKSEEELWQCIRKFNDITFHLATLPIKNHDDLEACLAVVKYLNANEGTDAYVASIDKMLANILVFLKETNSMLLCDNA